MNKHNFALIIPLILYFLSLSLTQQPKLNYLPFHCKLVCVETTLYNIFFLRKNQHEQFGPNLPALDDPHNHMTILHCKFNHLFFMDPNDVNIFVIKNVDELSLELH